MSHLTDLLDRVTQIEAALTQIKVLDTMVAQLKLSIKTLLENAPRTDDVDNPVIPSSSVQIYASGNYNSAPKHVFGLNDDFRPSAKPSRNNTVSKKKALSRKNSPTYPSKVPDRFESANQIFLQSENEGRPKLKNYMSSESSMQKSAIFLEIPKTRLSAVQSYYTTDAEVSNRSKLEKFNQNDAELVKTTSREQSLVKITSPEGKDPQIRVTVEMDNDTRPYKGNSRESSVIKSVCFNNTVSNDKADSLTAGFLSHKSASFANSANSDAAKLYQIEKSRSLTDDHVKHRTTGSRTSSNKHHNILSGSRSSNMINVPVSYTSLGGNINMSLEHSKESEMNVITRKLANLSEIDNDGEGISMNSSQSVLESAQSLKNRIVRAISIPRYDSQGFKVLEDGENTFVWNGINPNSVFSVRWDFFMSGF